MTYEEIKRRVSAWGIQTEFSTSERAAIEEIYYGVFGRTLPNCNCPNRFRDAVIELRIFTKNHSTMEKSKYVLKAGVIIQPTGTSNVYTNDNLTDEVAERFLNERPGARGLFEVIPNTAEVEKTPENEQEPENAGRIAELEAEVESLKEKLAEMTEYRNRAVADLDALVKKIEESNVVLEPKRGDDEKPNDEDKKPESEQAAPAEKPGINPEVLAAIKARLEAGDTKSAIIKDYVGIEIDGKPLTEYGVKKYITAATTPSE